MKQVGRGDSSGSRGLWFESPQEWSLLQRFDGLWKQQNNAECTKRVTVFRMLKTDTMSTEEEEETCVPAGPTCFLPI